MKCDICREKISETFLSKIKGTQIKDSKGKVRSVCSNCQKQLKTKEQILSRL